VGRKPIRRIYRGAATISNSYEQTSRRAVGKKYTFHTDDAQGRELPIMAELWQALRKRVAKMPHALRS
jgi:hypothetical protein